MKERRRFFATCNDLLQICLSGLEFMHAVLELSRRGARKNGIDRMIKLAVSQGIGVATGIQDKFSWKGVALAGITAAATLGVNASGIFNGIGNTFAQGAASAATANGITQGIGVATGLQKKFDWAGVAAAGVTGGVDASAAKAMGVNPMVGKNADTSLGNQLRQAAATAASAIAGAASRSLVTGTSFGDVLSVLPDVIGSTIGNAIGYGVSGGRGRRVPPPEAPSFLNAAPLGSGSGTALVAPGLTSAVANGPMRGEGGAGRRGDRRHRHPPQRVEPRAMGGARSRPDCPLGCGRNPKFRSDPSQRRALRKRSERSNSGISCATACLGDS